MFLICSLQWIPCFSGSWHMSSTMEQWLIVRSRAHLISFLASLLSIHFISLHFSETPKKCWQVWSKIWLAGATIMIQSLVDGKKWFHFGAFGWGCNVNPCVFMVPPSFLLQSHRCRHRFTRQEGLVFFWWTKSLGNWCVLNKWCNNIYVKIADGCVFICFSSFFRERVVGFSAPFWDFHQGLGGRYVVDWADGSFGNLRNIRENPTQWAKVSRFDWEAISHPYSLS